MNKVIHFEVPADDVVRAQGFYKNVFGWGINPMPEMDYTIVMTGPTDNKTGVTEPGYINGGMMKRSPMVKSPVITIDVPDIDEALAKVEQAGGKTLVAKMDVGDMGYSAYFIDSEGNTMGLWENKTK